VAIQVRSGPGIADFGLKNKAISSVEDLRPKLANYISRFLFGH
jgi:hypothetical protein